MDKRKWVFLAGFALAMFSLGWGTDDQQRAQSKRPEQTKQVEQSGQVERRVAFMPGSEKMPRMRSVTAAQRKAAALRAAAARAEISVKGGKAGILAAPLAAPSPGGTPDYFGTYANWAYTPTTLRKFVDTLPGLGSSNANNRGQYIPIATPMDASAAGVPADGDYYEIGLSEYTVQMHQDLPPTRLRGYRDLNPNGDGASQYLGPLIIAQKDRPVRIKFSNLLGPDSSFFLPVDTTVMGAGNGPTGNPYSVNRATLHLHGGNTPWISDGTPHQWTTPAGETTAYPKGMSTQNVPDMPTPGDGQMTFYYSNQQSGRLLFYHDHAYGITRLNVYAGEAAGYLIHDPIEDALIFNGSSGVIPNNGGGVYTYGIPLIIQDKTFVDASKIALQDPTWNWGTTSPTPNTGDLWLPHVYMPNQNPYDLTGTAAMGRWDYGPWFWPVFPPAHGEVTNPYYGTSPVEPPMIPGTPNPSIVPEAFMDTPIVNGTAYPKINVEPKAYRLRILNACNDRFLNLQLYQADPAANTEVRMIPAVAGPTIPAYWPTMEGRAGGVPDPLLLGPNMIQIGSESGLLPAPVELLNTPIGYNYNRRDIVVLNVQEKTLFLGPAERADVIVDFSAFAGKTLILYNDAPAPVPAFDPRNDYYTGDPDQTDTGGAPSTVAGFGPNTRTIMQIVVGGSTSDPFTFSLPALQAALPAAYAASQHAPIVPEAVYGPAYGTTYQNNYVRIQNTSFSFAPDALTPPTIMPLEAKAVQELFEMDYGRMNATLGVERPNTNATIQTTIPYGYIDPPTELLKDGEPQIWKITHNGVDTHAIHFHLFDVQVINRVGWDGAVRPPDANELGWKETVKMNPLEDAIVALRPQKQSNLPWPLPNSIRPLDVTRPIGSDMGFFGVNPDGNPVTVLNQMINFGWEYVWHCHLLGHEENDMMRPSLLAVPPEAPSNLVGIKNPNGASMDLSWVDNSMGETGFTVQRATDDTFTTNLMEISLGPNVTNFNDTGLDPLSTYFWRVFANNLVGDINTLGFPILQANSVPTPAIGFGLNGPITILVNAPNGGESWITGSIHNVTWTQSGMTGMANVDLYKGGVFLKNLGTADVTTGVFAWTIDAAEAGGIDYRVRVSQGGMWDQSDANFTIMQAPRLYMFIKNVVDTSVQMNTMLANETFQGLKVLTPGGTSTTPTTGVFNNLLHLVLKDPVDEKIWYRNMNGTGTWGSLSLLSGTSPSTASMAAFNNRLYLAVRGSDNGIYYQYQDITGNWNGWINLPGGTTEPPVIAAYNGRLHMVVKDSFGDRIWWNSMDNTGLWAGWQLISGLSPAYAAMAEFNNRLYLFVRGTDDNLYYRFLDNSGTWSAWTRMSSGTTPVSPCVAAFNGRLYIIVKSSTDTSIYMRSMDAAETWGNWAMIPGLTMIPVALAVF